VIGASLADAFKVSPDYHGIGTAKAERPDADMKDAILEYAFQEKSDAIDTAPIAD
jgi:hypothetical protein